MTFTGPLPQAEVFSEMMRADLLLVPSVEAPTGDREGVPNVLKEANACGLPAIVSDHGGSKEIVEDGKTGFVVPVRDSRALAQKCAFLLMNRGARFHMGIRAREKMIAEFSIDKTTAILERHYDEVIESYWDTYQPAMIFQGRPQARPPSAECRRAYSGR